MADHIMSDINEIVKQSSKRLDHIINVNTESSILEKNKSDEVMLDLISNINKYKYIFAGYPDKAKIHELIIKDLKKSHDIVDKKVVTSYLNRNLILSSNLIHSIIPIIFGLIFSILYNVELFLKYNPGFIKGSAIIITSIFVYVFVGIFIETLLEKIRFYRVPKEYRHLPLISTGL